MILPLFDALGAKYNLPDEITLIIIQYVKTHMAKAFVNENIESDVCRVFVEHQRELFLHTNWTVSRLSFYNQLLANAHLHVTAPPGTWLHLLLKTSTPRIHLLSASI